MIPKRGKNEFTTAGEPRTRGDDPNRFGEAAYFAR